MSSPANKLNWYFNRLRAMSVAELCSRLGEAVKRRISAVQPYGWNRFDSAHAELPFIAIDRARLPLIDADTRERWRSLVPSCDRPGMFQALNHAFAISGDIDWHQDPVSGIRWPDQAYCFDIAYRHDRNRGDVKLVWELNRLQFVPVIAALSVLDDDDTLAQLSLDLIESWIDANPPFKGINWVSGIELALRVVSILSTIGWLGRQRVDDRLARKIGGCLAAHLYWLKRYPSRHSSANNHLIAEAAAIFILETLWSRGGIGPSAADEAREVLIAEAFRQFHDDGVGAEQSPTYTAFTCEWYLLAFKVASQAGRSFPRDVVARIGAAGECLHWFIDESGNHPRIGDDDEGRVISSGAGHEPDYVASIAQSIAAATDRDDVVIAGVKPGLRSTLLGWRAGVPSAADGTRIFARGGYSVCRKRLNGRTALVAFDHGPLGYLAIAAHGHADALALALHLDGEPVLVDPGTYLYHAGGATRDRLRGTAAHNTVCIDGQNQSKIVGAFNWRDAANAHLASCDRDGATDRIVGRHDGYVGRYGLICEREVCIDDAGLTIRDNLIAVGADRRQSLQSIDIGFLLHPDLTAELDDSEVRVSRAGVPVMSFRGATGLRARLQRADYSPAFGVMQSATRIVFSATDSKQRAFSLRIDVELATSGISVGACIAGHHSDRLMQDEFPQVSGVDA